MESLYYSDGGDSGSPVVYQTSAYYFGNYGDLPVVGDWDCDGDDTVGVAR